MHRRLRTGIVVLILCGLIRDVPLQAVTACEPAAAPASGSASQDPETRADLLRYFDWLLTGSNEQRTAQYERVRAQLADPADPRAQLVMALLLSLPDTSFTDYQRAHALVADFIAMQGDGNPADAGLARLLRVLFEELEKKDNEIARLGTQLEQLKQIEKDLTHTEQSVNVTAPTPATLGDERKAKDSDRR
jgi:hypothetical protein